MSSAATVDEEVPVAVEPVKKGKGKLFAILGLLILAAAGGGGWFYWQQQKAPAAKDSHTKTPEAAKPAAAALYLPMTPPFVVNLGDMEAMRYLQADMEIMTRDPKVLEAVKLHMPRLRDRILLLLSQQRTIDINTREGKEALQAKILAEIQGVLQQETGASGVEAVYFTSFVMQ